MVALSLEAERVPLERTTPWKVPALNGVVNPTIMSVSPSMGISTMMACKPLGCVQKCGGSKSLPCSWGTCVFNGFSRIHPENSQTKPRDMT